jgi:hypothetical protein
MYKDSFTFTLYLNWPDTQYVELKTYHPGLPLAPQFMTVILNMESSNSEH